MAKKILVIDDSQTIRKYVLFTAKRCGYEVIEAVDGKDGLEKIQQNPDLAMVVCDLNMPELDGFEVIAKAKNELKSTVPIVVLTTVGSDEAIQKAQSLGAVGYMNKPFKPDELQITIKKLVGDP